MKKILFVLFFAVITAFSDTVYMTNGFVVSGNIVTQDNNSVVILSNGQNITLNRAEIAQIQMGNSQQQMQQTPAQQPQYQQQYPQQQVQQNYQPIQQQPQYYQRPPVNRDKVKGAVLTGVGGGLLAFGLIAIPVGLAKTIHFAKFDTCAALDLDDYYDDYYDYDDWNSSNRSARGDTWYFWNNNDNQIDSADSKHPGLGLLITGGVCGISGSIILSQGVKKLKAAKSGQPVARFIPDDVYLGMNEEKITRNRYYSARLSWAAF